MYLLESTIWIIFTKNILWVHSISIVWLISSFLYVSVKVFNMHLTIQQTYLFVQWPFIENFVPLEIVKAVRVNVFVSVWQWQLFCIVYILTIGQVFAVFCKYFYLWNYYWRNCLNFLDFVMLKFLNNIWTFSKVEWIKRVCNINIY